MRSYWIKIVLGALAVFAVGMIITTIIRRVRHVAESSPTIEFPLAFVPFRLDGERVGELRHVRIMRATPDSVTGVHVRVELADSATAQRIEECILVLHDLQHIDNRTTFACAAAADTARQDLVPFGTVQLGRGGAERPFLVPRSEVTAAHGTEAGWERASEYGDSVADAIEERADSAAEAAEALADSLSEMEMQRADSIRAEGLRLADSIRAASIPPSE